MDPAPTSTPSTPLTLSVSPNSKLQLDPLSGRILHLSLCNTTIIKSVPPTTDLSSGSYLMYPWVNRLEQPHPLFPPVFTDGNGLPLHGLLVNQHVQIQLSEQGQGDAKEIIVLATWKGKEGLCGVKQVFTLGQRKFSCHVEVQGQPQIPVCFGYHPYLQINNQQLSTLKIETNIRTNLKLDQKTLLPVYPLVETDTIISGSEKYDHLFRYSGEGDAYLRLIGEGEGKKTTVEIRSPDMRYWQVYTPPDGCRIAVEPTTFFGNIYKLYNKEEFGELPLQGNFTISLL